MTDTTELRCARIDPWLQGPCGFPATVTIQHEGETLGICRHDVTQAIVSGYVVTPLAPTLSEED